MGRKSASTSVLVSESVYFRTSGLKSFTIRWSAKIIATGGCQAYGRECCFAAGWVSAGERQGKKSRVLVIGRCSCCGHAGTGRAVSVGWDVLRCCGCPSPGVSGSGRTVRPNVVINRVSPGAAWRRPGSRQRSTGFVQGAAGLLMVSWRALLLCAHVGSSRPPASLRKPGRLFSIPRLHAQRALERPTECDFPGHATVRWPVARIRPSTNEPIRSVMLQECVGFAALTATLHDRSVWGPRSVARCGHAKVDRERLVMDPVSDQGADGPDKFS